jgi:hypothetical protein
MLKSRTLEEWKSAFQNVRQITCFLPSLVEKLEMIHDSPKYYSDYHLQEMLDGSLGRGTDQHRLKKTTPLLWLILVREDSGVSPNR